MGGVLTERLMNAILAGDASAVVALLRAGADPVAPDSEGTTPLYLASVQGEAEVALLLLEAGASPDAESGHGDQGTPLCGATAHGHADTVRVLLEHGADPNPARGPWNRPGAAVLGDAVG